MNDDELKELLEQATASLKAEYKLLDETPTYTAAPPRRVMVPMSDGISLNTITRTPEGEGPFPTIVMRSSYPFLDVLHNVHGEEYCKRGFAFVYQFCRGVGGSEGQWIPNVHDRRDGKQTLDWLAGQNWVENIGYLGSSYLAFTGWIIADLIPEKVKTMYLTHYGTDRFTSAYQNGLFRQDVLTAWAMENAGFPIDADYMESLKFRPQIAVDEKLWGRRIDWYRDWITNTNRSDPYWQSGFWKLLKKIPSKIKFPIYIGEGWYDHHLGSALRTYEDLSPKSKMHSVLRIGAWNHNFMPCVEGTECHNLQNSDTHSAFDWFDTILRKKELPQGRILTYQIGKDCWQEQPAFPFSKKNHCIFYLSAKKTETKAYTLSTNPDTGEVSLTYRYDPDDPVMSHGAESLLRTITDIGSLLQPEPGWRRDVISFVSQPIQQDLDILGKIKVKLYVSSTAEDTAFTAKLMEVYKNGQAYNIRSGITTLGYREGTEQHRITYKPGRIVEAVVDLWDISWRLHQGSRIRIDISSSDFPQYAIHTNYPGVWSLQDKAKIAEQSLYFGVNYPAQIILPLNEDGQSQDQ